MKKLWEKGVSLNKEIEEFTIGKDRELDLSLARYDVIGTLAHAEMLCSIGILEEIELSNLRIELLDILKAIDEDRFIIEPGVEDVHSQVEKMLTEQLGDTGKKVHTGRSRNDQVSLDLHLLVRHEIAMIARDSQDFFNALMLLARENSGLLLPGYTHFQVAMPASFGLWFSSFAEDLTDDMILLQGAYKIASHNPLGAGAGFGSSIPLNRKMTTELLGFDSLRYNSMHSMMARGKLEKTAAQALSSLAGTLSRMAMDTTLYLGQNFDFISFPEEYTTGSSIMPHKKNPDVFELIRGKCNKIKAMVSEIDLVTGNLPSGYHRDYQVLKETFIPAFREMHFCMNLAEKVLLQIKIRENILEDPAYKYITSVDKVNKMVTSGVPFRDAYQAVAQQIRNNTFAPDTNLAHTHEGSLGNLCLDEIRNKMDERMNAFGFEKADIAIKNLLRE